jgi:elongation factor P
MPQGLKAWFLNGPNAGVKTPAYHLGFIGLIQTGTLRDAWRISPVLWSLSYNHILETGFPIGLERRHLYNPRTKSKEFLFMAIPATQMRPGMIIKHNNELHSVFSVEHRTPGNLRAFIQAKLRNLRSGGMFEHRFRSADAIDRVVVDEIAMEFLYNDGDDYYFMDQETFEQTHLKHDTLGDAVEYLTPNLLISVSFHDGKAVGIELPTVVEMTVVETEPGIKSATASSVTKPAKTETGLVVQVPPFINEGEKIRVDTAEGAYMSRA